MRLLPLLALLAASLAPGAGEPFGLAATTVTGWTCRDEGHPTGRDLSRDRAIVCEARLLLPVVPAGDFGLLVDSTASAHEAHVNGSWVGGLGAVGGRRYAPLPIAYRVRGTLVFPGEPVSIRIRSWRGDLSPGLIQFGSWSAVEDAWRLRKLDPLRRLGLNILLDMIGLVLAAFGLREYFVHRRDAAFLWFALALFFETAGTAFFLFRYYLVPLPLGLTLWTLTLLSVPCFLCFEHFARAFIGYAIDPKAIALEAAYLLSSLAIPLELFHQPLALTVLARAQSVALVSMLAYYPVKAMLERRTGLPKMIRLLLIPLVFLAIQATLRLAGLPVTISVGPLVVNYALLSFGSLLLALALLMLERASGQQVEQENTPGLIVDAVYLPAAEVGGDFYQLLPDGNATLIVVGDVSGKGLKAAMSVALIVGALRNHRAQRPAALLTELNAALIGRLDGSFITCVCARLEAAGRVLIANAGHVPPYADGHEVTCEGALPLGIASDATYQDVSLRARHLLFLSDGVAEARGPSGELFGFERAHEMSARRSWEIAR
ncbi:MAG: PP2C family protein-serine/threonine phosphatase, partial [Acidobacteria bacterium]|nr:PP2C family protein-serine/threonine phosphatase [Acidobacteriota bacterium]